MLNEERAIGETLTALREGAPEAEIIVVDGGSTDQSLVIARSKSDRVLEAARGRARQMNAGASVATGDVLAFVHADTIVSRTFAAEIGVALDNSQVCAGRFDVGLDDPRARFRILEAAINLRSRLTRSGTGDQAIFVRREVFERLGGYADIALCEDVDLVRRLRRIGKIACVPARVITSARRWREGGLVRTIVRMWIVKSLFLMGVPPATLKRRYTDTR